MQLLISLTLLSLKDVEIYIDSLGLTLLILATTLIAASGYVINDLYDITADRINKPSQQIIGVIVSVAKAKKMYALLIFSGVCLGFINSILIHLPWFTLYFIGCGVLLYMYARWFKSIAFLGNGVVSLLVFLSVILIPVFLIVSPTQISNTAMQWGVFYIFLVISLFAFGITFVRELVKDIEDLQGDHAAGYKTAPIILGSKRTERLTAYVIIVYVAILFICAFTFLKDEILSMTIIIVAIIFPLGYCGSKLWSGVHKKELSQLSIILKVIMFVGICLIPFWVHTILYA